jgi:imidazolonepropionase-like amidohydrolase
LTCDKRIAKASRRLGIRVDPGLDDCDACPGGGQESQPTVIRAGVVIDGTGSSPRENVVIVIRDGRIVEVRSATQADVANPSAIDLTGFYVLPGLIDVHAHLTLSHDPDLDYGEISAPASGILGVMHAKRTLMAGFTTVRDPTGPYYADVALRDAIAAGWVEARGCSSAVPSSP